MSHAVSTSAARRRRQAALLVSLAMLLANCAGLPAARMELPATLGAQVPEPVPGIGLGREGSFVLGDDQVRYTRGRDRLELFDAVSFDRSRTRYTLTRADGRVEEAACRGRRDTVTARAVEVDVTPFTWECEWRGGVAPARLTVSAPAWTAGMRAERRGQFRAGDVELQLESVHRVQGSPLALEQPIGYLMRHRGEPVGAIELNGDTPRLWRPAPGHALAEPVTRAALALALLWDPADAAP